MQRQNKIYVAGHRGLVEAVAEMVREDLKAAERDELVKRHGYYTNEYHE